MDDNTKINNIRYRIRVFNSLMDIVFNPSLGISQEKLEIELLQAEKDGKLKIYNPTKEA